MIASDLVELFAQRRVEPRLPFAVDFGKIDILINNAGIAGVNATVWETSVDEWRRVMRINLDGPFVCSKAVVPHMI